MREAEAKEYVLSQTVVTRQLVTLGKGFLQSMPGHGPHETLLLPSKFAEQQGFRKPNQVVLHPSVDPLPALNQAAGYYSRGLALGEAIWSLVHQGYFLALGNLGAWSETNIGWTTVVPGSGGHSGGWSFDELRIELPRFVALAPSLRHERPDPLTDANLFALAAGVPGAHQEVAEALEDAIHCFRADLYRPATIMLGKAMEGAWIELGCTLARVASEVKDSNKFAVKMRSEDVSISRKISDVLALYERKELDRIVRESGIRAPELRSVVIWSDVLRDARNAIHFGAAPVLGNTYEKVAVLLLEGAKSLQMIYQVKAVAERAADA